MNLSRWLGGMCCLCLMALSAQAQTNTMQNFSVYPPNPTTPGGQTFYAEYGSFSGMVMNDGPASAKNYYRLTQAGVGSTNNTISFDLTAPGPTSHVVVDFDYRIGGTADAGNPNNHADGMGFALLNTAVYNATDNGVGQPNITEEAQGVYTAARDNSFGFGLDTWDNGPPPPNGGNNYDPDNNHVSLSYVGGDITVTGAGARTAGTGVLWETSLTPFGYNLHRGESPEPVFSDSATPFDHFHLTIDFSSAGATVTVTITPNSTGGAAFSPLNGMVVPNALPYEMRAAFGARTGGSTDNADVANVNISFSP